MSASRMPNCSLDARQKAVDMLIKSGIEPSPENLVSASKKKRHPLHRFFWETPENDWAHFGRYEAARWVLRTTMVEFSIGGKKLEVRAVEYTRPESGARWASMREIVATPELLDGYMREIQTMNESAADKMEKLRELMKSPANKESERKAA